VSTPSSNVDGALLWPRRTALHAKVVYKLRWNGPMRTRCAEKLILSINKDASALFLLANKRRIVRRVHRYRQALESIRVSPMPPTRRQAPRPAGRARAA